MFELGRYLRTETIGGLVLLGATAVALVLANSPLAGFYLGVRDSELGPHLLHLNLTVGDWAKDGLLALFFFVAGLELKRELVIGELADRRAAVLPVIAAVGGMVVPIGIALAVGAGAPGMDTAWAIPAATDIAFALAVLAITGQGMPASARVFLLSLAVVDDLGAIALIAVLFTASIDLVAAGVAVALLAGYALLQRLRVRSSWIYVPVAAATWIAVHSSGVHATVAGVALALLTRVRADPGEEEAPCLRLEHRLQPWSAGLAVPAFALFAAGVPIGAEALGRVFADRVALAVIAGLLVGKVVGIVAATALAVAIRVAVRPTGLNWRDITAVGVLGGVGFTVSLLIAELSLPPDAVETAKAAVLLASAGAALIASVLLIRRGRARELTRED